MKPPLFQIASTHDFKTHNTIVLHGSLSQGKCLEHTQFQFEKPHNFNLKPLEQKLFFRSGNTKFQFGIIGTCFRALHQTYTPQTICAFASRVAARSSCAPLLPAALSCRRRPLLPLVPPPALPYILSTSSSLHLPYYSTH